MKSGSRKNDGAYKLTDERIAKLEEIGFQWKVLATFEERLAELQRFKNKHGHCNVPKRYEENKSLGYWCSTIRMMKSGSKPNDGVHKLTDDRITKLKEMGFRWKATATFEDHLADLHRFKNEHGHCNVPKEYKENKSLGIWCQNIRQIKSGGRKNNGAYKLTDERITKLEEMGFRWIVRKRGSIKTFEDRLVDLHRFKNEHGHCNVPFHHEKNKSLGYWCCRIRQVKSGSRKNDGVYKLTDERIAKLEEMGFQFP
ncbi:hypothetical protein CTEN210_14990 [Chaetoceros tenuissimus]|uniref:Helicase-associated domain-containing protein n=1 Tax=Chaetoceros tenuissimus TaxID=426638 RepID=A0AAD3D9H4_9STRA|nr:hypothetical protein CTEN210_14990 [Chaetoceros tenuissimus]